MLRYATGSIYRQIRPRFLTRAGEPWTEEQLHRAVLKSVDKNGEWKGLIPEQPLQFSELAPDTDYGEAIGRKTAVVTFVSALSSCAAIYYLIDAFNLKRPYETRHFVDDPGLLKPTDFNPAQFKPAHAYKPNDHQWNYIGKFAYTKTDAQ